MNKFETFLSKRNFKKIAIWYIIAALVVGLACAGTVAYLYRQRLSFAWKYAKLEDIKQDDKLRSAVDQLADASDDVVDVLILDRENNVTYSAKNSEFASGKLELAKVGNEKKYLASAAYPNAVFQYVKDEEFMLNSIINKDFGKIREDYDDDSAFERELSFKTIYMLSRVRQSESGNWVYVITIPTNVKGGVIALKATAALAVLFLCIYWVLVALWIYADAAKSKLSPLYWGLIGLFTNLIGLIIYKIYKRNAAICPACGAAQSASHLYCSYCGGQLGVRCASCGGKVGPKDRFCHHCGKEL